MDINSHFVKINSAIQLLEYDPIRKAARMIFEAWKDKKRVYTFGNGGSASTAEHFASGLLKELGVMAYPLASWPLGTAIANDVSYDMTFAAQLERYIDYKDVVIGISCSGNSPNVVSAFIPASRPALLINRILITGPKKHPYQLSSCDVVIHVNTKDIMVAEDLHLAICHSIEKQLAAMIQEHNSLMHENQPVAS